MKRDFWELLIGFWLLVLAGGFFAYIEGYCFRSQVLSGAQVPEKFLTYVGHAGVVVLFLFTCPLKAWIMSRYAQDWSGLRFCEALILGFIGAAIMQQGWINDTVPSALVRNGLRIPGTLNMFSMGWAFAIAAMYYIPALTSEVNREYTWIVSAIFAVQILAGILLPPYVVHGAIHTAAWAQAGIGCGIILALHVIRVRY